MRYHIAKNGKKDGPFSGDQIQSMLETGMISQEDSAWVEGMNEWKPLNQVLSRPPNLAAISESFERPATDSIVESPARQKPASFLIRACAHLIDMFLAYIILMSVMFVVLSLSFDAPGAIAGLISVWLYYALMESSPKQATVGKNLFGLVVVDLEGRRISFLRASGRSIGILLSTLTLLIGFLMCIWTARKQCLHDMLAQCLVLQKKRG